MFALEALVGNKTAERALLFLFANHESHAARIAKECALPKSQVLKQLVRLENGGILNDHYVGKARIFRIAEQCPFRNELLQLLAKAILALPPEEARLYEPHQEKKTLRVDPAKRADLEKMIELAAKHYNPTRIILFGSQARGDWHENSDIDLMFVFDELPEKNTAGKLYVLAGKNKIYTPMDLATITEERFLLEKEKKNAIYNRIATEGVTIYERSRSRKSA